MTAAIQFASLDVFKESVDPRCFLARARACAQRDLQLALAFPRHKDAMPKRTTLTFTSEDAPKSGEDTLYVYYCKYSGKHALTIGEQPFSTATNARCRTFILTLFPQMRTSPSSRSGEQTGQESRTLTSTM